MVVATGATLFDGVGVRLGVMDGVGTAAGVVGGMLELVGSVAEGRDVVGSREDDGVVDDDAEVFLSLFLFPFPSLSFL